MLYMIYASINDKVQPHLDLILKIHINKTTL